MFLTLFCLQKLHKVSCKVRSLVNTVIEVSHLLTSYLVAIKVCS